MINRYNRIGIICILFSLSVENRSLLNYTFAGIGPVDIGIMFGLLFMMLGTQKINRGIHRVSKYTFVMVSGLVITTLYSLLQGYKINYMLADIRNFVFLLAAYILFKDAENVVDYIAEIIPIFGLLNCLVFLSQASFFTGHYVREIYTPLWIAILTVGCCLFRNENANLYRYAVAFISVITIIISETRSYIFPLAIMAVSYLIISVKRRQYVGIVSVLLISVLAFWYFSKAGMVEKIVNRINGSFDDSSTMWLRLENGIEQLRNMSGIEKIIGRGFGERFLVVQYDGSLRETSDLEMVLFNQIIEWGYPLVIFNLISWTKTVITGIRRNRNLPFIITGIGMMIGGFISGFVGAIGSVVLGMLVGILSRTKVERYDNNDRMKTNCVAI